MTFARLALIAAAIGLAPGLVAAQTPPGDMIRARAMMNACRVDYQKLCDGVQPGGGRVLACLSAHADQLSSPCAQVLPKAQALQAKAAAAGAAPK